jgi:hypothetical protein
MDVYTHFYTSALVRGASANNARGRRAHGTHWVGPRAGLDDMKWKFFILPRFEWAAGERVKDNNCRDSEGEIY